MVHVRQYRLCDVKYMAAIVVRSLGSSFWLASVIIDPTRLCKDCTHTEILQLAVTCADYNMRLRPKQKYRVALENGDIDLKWRHTSLSVAVRALT